MKKYVLVGVQALEFPDLRVEPSVDGTLFEYDLDPAREALLIRGGSIVVAPEAVQVNRKKGAGGGNSNLV